MNVGKEIAALQAMTVKELREKHAEVFGDPTRSGHRQYLVRRIAWRIQSLAEGDLSERARRRAMQLARDQDIRTTMPRGHAVPVPNTPEDASERTKIEQISIASDDRLPLPGNVLDRKYKGKTHIVTVLTRGFEYDGEVYRTLSAVAKAITGTHWNGYHFFKLGKRGVNETDE